MVKDCHTTNLFCPNKYHQPKLIFFALQPTYSSSGHTFYSCPVLNFTPPSPPDSAAACRTSSASPNTLEEACQCSSAVVSRAHQLSAGTRGLGHHQTAALLTVSRLMIGAPLTVPRRFFQTLQKTVISVSRRGKGRSVGD